MQKGVKPMLPQLTVTLIRLLATAGLSGLMLHTSLAQAEDINARTMLNATQVATMLDGVVPEKLHIVIEKLEDGSLHRLAPEQPIWVLELIDETILYYQGQPDFTGQPASKLVDDAGNRFGTRAVNHAKQSRSVWLTLKLGDANYKAYCRAQDPIVVCSLIP